MIFRILFTVASLGWVSTGAATEGVAPTFPEKKTKRRPYFIFSWKKD